uniref:Uncharacterized protein n=1 Tax=Glossina pallidipes TaxID=7398 RepID=A0A1A9ZSC2_GLOPL
MIKWQFMKFYAKAYKRQSNSVKIAKITAFTVIISSFILGSFILASSYLQAKASCDQVQALDSVLEKELMLETLQQVNKYKYFLLLFTLYCMVLDDSIEYIRYDLH